MKSRWIFTNILMIFALITIACGAATNLVISEYQYNGQLTFSQVENAIEYSVEWASSLGGPWSNSWDSLAHIPTNTLTNITISVPMFYRVLAWYRQPSGAIQAFIAPQQAIDAGAQWRLGTTGSWYNSGFTATDLPVNTYTLSFKTVTGWIAPASTNLIVHENETNSYIGAYGPDF